jgi:predicted dinucleotide-binding enzyme
MTALKLAVVGAGRLGRALGGRLGGEGHTIIYGGGENARDAAESQDNATFASNSDAADVADVIILTVPFAALPEAVTACGPLAGKVVWSCVNALNDDASGLAIGFDDSAAESVRRLAPEARLVAAIPPFADLIASGDVKICGAKPTVWMCGDDVHAKAMASRLLRELDVEPIDAGTLEISRYAEPAAMLLVRQAYAARPPRVLAVRLLQA